MPSVVVNGMSRINLPTSRQPNLLHTPRRNIADAIAIILSMKDSQQAVRLALTPKKVVVLKYFYEIGFIHADTLKRDLLRKDASLPVKQWRSAYEYTIQRSEFHDNPGQDFDYARCAVLPASTNDVGPYRNLLANIHRTMTTVDNQTVKVTISFRLVVLDVDEVCSSDFTVENISANVLATAQDLIERVSCDYLIGSKLMLELNIEELCKPLADKYRMDVKQFRIEQVKIM